jgi:hypothetical protein
MSPLLPSISLIAALTLLAGCEPPRSFQLEPTGVRATAGVTGLWADLPPAHDLATLVAVTEATLRSRGYTITDRQGLLEDPARIVASRGGLRPMFEAVVFIRMGVPQTRIEVRIDPFGHDAEQRAILAGIVKRLGY